MDSSFRVSCKIRNNSTGVNDSTWDISFRTQEKEFKFSSYFFPFQNSLFCFLIIAQRTFGSTKIRSSHKNRHLEKYCLLSHVKLLFNKTKETTWWLSVVFHWYHLASDPQRDLQNKKHDAVMILSKRLVIPTSTLNKQAIKKRLKDFLGIVFSLYPGVLRPSS